MKKVSNEFINLSKKIKTQDLKLTINDGELTVQEVHFMPVEIFNAIPISRLRERKEVIAKELKYSFEGQLFKTIMQQIEITVKNASEIKGKNVDFKYGILINNEFEHVDMGEYYIKDVEDDKNKEELIVTGYDKMLNFMIPFKQSDLKLTYPCKMGQLVNRMGEVCGVELYSTDFYNSNLIVDEDFFTIQELTYRDVLEKVAQTTLTTIFIKENKLYLCKIGESVQTLDTSFLSNLVIGEKFGPVNALVLGRGSVEDNIESVDQQSINTNGRCEIRFDENEFVDSKREEVIDEMFQQINGLEYYAIEASNLGILWLDPCDVIIAKDREESEYKTIYLKASVTINTGIKGEMEADIPEETTTEYKVTTKEEKKTLKVERLAKKNEGLIQDLIEENTETSQKLTEVKQTVDGITQKVENIADLTKNITGIKTIEIEDAVQGSPIELRILGNNTVFDSLRLSDDLYLGDDTVLYGDSKIEINEKIYDLYVDEVLRQYEGVYDEYIYNYTKNTAKIIRRIGVDNSGELYVLENEIVESITIPNLELNEGKNTISIPNYTANVSITYVAKNDFTNTLATKAIMKSSITETAQQIKSEVSEKYTTKEETKEVKSQISLKASSVLIDVTNGKTTAGIRVSLLDENGNVLDSKVGTIDMTGIVSFNDLAGEGKTVINGANIKSGTISSERLDTSIIHSVDGTIGGFKITESGLQSEGVLISSDGGSIFNNLHTVYEGTEYADLPTTKSYGVDSSATIRHINLIGDGTAMNVAGYTKNFNLYASQSDPQLKKNIKETKVNGLDLINKIEHIEFYWKNSDKFQANGYNAKQLGEICEDFVIAVEQPKGAEYSKILQVRDFNMMPYITKAIQELDRKVKELQEENRILKNMIRGVDENG